MTNTEPITTEGLLDAARHELDLAATATGKALVAHRTRIAHQYTRLADLFTEHQDATDDVTVAVELLRLASEQEPPEFGDNRPDWAGVAYARANIIAALPKLRRQALRAFGAATLIPTGDTGRSHG
jgi:hypothetical protein